MGNLTKNFSKREFDCRCGCDMPEDVYNNVKSLAIELQIIRDFTNESISINSGYRCLKHNRDIGSNDRSQHPKGKAADIVIDGYNPDEVYEIVQNLRRNPVLKGVTIQGIGRYNTFTHVDIRDYYANWDNRTQR